MASKIIYLALALFAAASAAPDSRLAGGSPTEIEQFPYISSFVYSYPWVDVQRCVGCLISSWHVLTTAFCFTGADLDNFQIRAGSTYSLSGGLVSRISTVVKHPDYVEEPRAFDIAVVTVTRPFPITDTTNILLLPPQNWYIPDGQQVKIVSWGFEYVGGPQLETLKTVNLYKLPLDTCQAMYAERGTVVISDPVICANQPGPVAAGMCLGDSGAPMVITTTSGNIVTGLASYYDGCGDETYPDVFTRIDRYTNWILETAIPQGRDGVGVRVAPGL